MFSAVLFYLEFSLKCSALLRFGFPYYNIPRKIRELQFVHNKELYEAYYNIPRKIISVFNNRFISAINIIAYFVLMPQVL